MKTKTVFACQECGAQSQKWLGRCAECGAWNSLVEERAAPEPVAATADISKRYSLAVDRGAAAVRGHRHTRRRAADDRHRGVRPRARWRRRAGVARSHRRRAGHRQVDAPAPGGRALCARRSGRCSTARARSPSTKSSRGASGSASSARRSTSWPRPVSSGSSRRSPASSRRSSSSIRSRRCSRCRFQSAPGSIGQVREAATQLLFAAKGQNIPTFLVGHVTKDGNLAGPKALEHIVDTVLYFEGEKHHSHRIVRAVKNRFGAVSELGRVRDDEHRSSRRAESVDSCSSPNGRRARRGRRCCAVSRDPGRCWSRSRRSSAPARTATRGGWRADSIRTGSRCCWRCSRNAPGLNLVAEDVFVNVAGGMTVDEPAADMGIVAAVASSVRNRPIKPSTAVFGEVGLAGEVRGISQAALRVREAAQMGFTRCVLPHGQLCSGRRSARLRARDGPERVRSARRADGLVISRSLVTPGGARLRAPGSRLPGHQSTRKYHR